MTTLPHEQNRYLPVEDVAKRFNVSVDTIYRWRRKGFFPSPIIFGPKTARWSLIQLMDFEMKLHANQSCEPCAKKKLPDAC